MGKSQNFSPASIDALQSGARQDPLTAGLCVIANGDGRKIWRFRRRVAKSGTVVTLKLGPFPAYSIPAARKWAAALNILIERGEDPRVAMRTEKAQQELTVKKAHEIYMAAMKRGDRKALYDLTENECWDAVYDKSKASKDRANKMAGELNCFLRWCSGREGRMAGIELIAHPAPTLNSNWFSTGARANTRFLSDDELIWLFQALVEESPFYRRGFILLLLTAARRNELFGAAATEFVDGIWTLPAERSKNGEANIIALGLWGRRLAETNHEWLFPSSRIDGPQLFGWFKARDRIHLRLEKLASSVIPSWHFHDLRRTFRSNARRLGIDRDIAELMLNHKRKGIEGIYDRNQELGLRAAGFAAWETFLRKLAGVAEVADELNAC